MRWLADDLGHTAQSIACLGPRRGNPSCLRRTLLSATNATFAPIPSDTHGLDVPLQFGKG